MDSLRNKTALITGSVRGLDKAIAERYAALGADIVLNYSRNMIAAEEMEKNIRAMGPLVVTGQADVSKVADIERLFAEAKKAFGKIDIVMANAGIEMAETPVTKFTEKQFDRLFPSISKALISPCNRRH